MKLWGNVLCLLGAALWIYGYFITGHEPLLAWTTIVPSWIAEFLPNLESEAGLALSLVGTIVVFVF